MFNPNELFSQFIADELRGVGNLFAKAIATAVSKRIKGDQADYRETWHGEIENCKSLIEKMAYAGSLIWSVPELNAQAAGRLYTANARALRIYGIALVSVIVFTIAVEIPSVQTALGGSTKAMMLKDIIVQGSIAMLGAFTVQLLPNFLAEWFRYAKGDWARLSSGIVFLGHGLVAAIITNGMMFECLFAGMDGLIDPLKALVLAVAYFGTIYMFQRAEQETQLQLREASYQQI